MTGGSRHTLKWCRRLHGTAREVANGSRSTRSWWLADSIAVSFPRKLRQNPLPSWQRIDLRLSTPSYRKRVEENAADQVSCQPPTPPAGRAAPFGGTSVGMAIEGVGGGSIWR
jgi:hypothetical protein